MKIGRNEPCPCGSGKKFKKCHMGKEDELFLNNLGDMPVEEMGARIAGLPLVNHGRSREMIDALDIQELTGKTMGIKCIDLESYADLNLFGTGKHKKPQGDSGGILINIYKTIKADPDHLYLAISPDISDSTFVHELAHILDYLGGSELMPGTMSPLSLELSVPAEHLEHPEEYGRWLAYLAEKFEVQLDAEDAIVFYLYRHGMLIKGKEIQAKNAFVLKSKSDRILKFLSEQSTEIDGLIKDLPGYTGPKEAKD